MKPRTGKVVVSGILICLALLVFLLAGSCGKRKAKAPTVVPTATVPATQRETSRRIPRLDELLRQLKNLKKPANTEPKVWAAMKKDMRDFLLRTFGGGKGASRLPFPYYKNGLLPTTGYVLLRDFHWEPVEDTYGDLVWTYVNDGDYNQDGIVAIGDMTPLAVHLGEPEGDPNSITEMIDEDDEPVLRYA